MGKSKGFTLLELLMVVIIIAILASIALPQYLKAMEKSRATEAFQILGQIRSSEGRYKASSASGVYTAVPGEIDAIDTTNTGLTQTRSWGNYGGNANGLTLTALSSSFKRSGGIYNQGVLGMRHDNGALCGNFAATVLGDTTAPACP